jgi:hypothetical protein
MEERNVDLNVWLPATFGLGVATMGLMALFIRACDRV